MTYSPMARQERQRRGIQMQVRARLHWTLSTRGDPIAVFLPRKWRSRPTSQRPHVVRGLVEYTDMDRTLAHSPASKSGRIGFTVMHLGSIGQKHSRNWRGHAMANTYTTRRDRDWNKQAISTRYVAVAVNHIPYCVSTTAHPYLRAPTHAPICSVDLEECL